VDHFGCIWYYMDQFGTTTFSGQEKCLVDKSGRVKLPTRFTEAFKASDHTVVAHCLSEGALALYPLSVWQQMRQAEPRPAPKAAESIVFRRQLRRFGALSQQQQITNQGRVTIPPAFREMTKLDPGTEAYLVGAEIGLEVWNAERWEQELKTLQEHEQEKAQAEMAADVMKERQDHSRTETT